MNFKFIKSILLWLIGPFLSYQLLITAILFYKQNSLEGVQEILIYTAQNFCTTFIGWGLLVLPFILFKLFQYLSTSWKNDTRMVLTKKTSLTVILPIVFIFFGFNFSKWYTQSEETSFTWDHSFDNLNDTIQNRYKIDNKQRGIHFFGHHSMDSLETQKLLRTNLEWITLVPFIDQADYDSETIGRKSTDYETWSRRDSFYMTRIRHFQAEGFRIMVKPHIWLYRPSEGKWRSDISPKTEALWGQWSESYRLFMLHYAKLSELYNIELFCIGTELHKTVVEHPDFWEKLIDDIRKVYSGKITYAANWNKEMSDVSFWNKLDYISIQAYFPLTSKKEPSVKELKKGWGKHLSKIEALHQQYNKPILFSEIGYKSTLDAAIEPWAWANSLKSIYTKVSYETQANCYEAFFQTFWDKEWFAGVHFWEWQAGHHNKDSKKNINFTPQMKPAENIMTKWFSKISNPKNK